MARLALQIALASAVYGFSVGSLHSFRLGTWNLLKFPLLIFLTSLICAIAYYVSSQFITKELPFREVVRLALSTFRDVAVLLASLGPVCFFLARTVVQPDERGLNEYPFFLGLNVFFIALSGTAALVRQTLGLLRKRHLTLRRSALIVLAWLALSLFAGGQCAWVLRPFYGPATIKDIPFMEGSNPDYRGARSFYEAVYHLFDPPPLPKGYYRRGRTGERSAVPDVLPARATPAPASSSAVGLCPTAFAAPHAALTPRHGAPPR